MSVESPRIRSLMRQADSVAAAGKRAAAEQLYRQIIDEAPETAGAWRGLAEVSNSQEEREAAMLRAQELDPEPEPVENAPEDIVEDAPGQEGDTAGRVGETTFSRDGQVSDERSVESVASARAASSSVDAIDNHVHAATGLHAEAPAESREILYCANHPGRTTHLRCNRCGKPICTSCANPTPVGYRCPECIREQEDVYFSATPLDYLVTVLVAFPLSLVVGWLATAILSTAFGFFLIFLGAFTGSLIGRIAFRAAGRRRGRWLPHLTVACVIVGGLLPALGFLVAALFGQFSLRLIFLGIYLVTAAGATYYQMR